MTLSTRLLLLCCLLSTALLAQKKPVAVFTGCGAEVLDKMHPEHRIAQEKIDRQIYEDAMQGPVAKKFGPGARNLPVVIHIVHNGGPENITDAQVLQGMQQLNAAFDATFGTGVNTDIQFCLAQRDPNGQVTNGITRNQSPLTAMTMETEDLSLKNINRWAPTCYINIWIVSAINSGSFGPNVVGYAYLPGAHGSTVDGIVMEADYFGSSQANSSVIVHEIGHYLGLYHTFQGTCQNNDCLLDGDLVCDTPPDQTTFASCSPNANSCSTDANDTSPNNPFTTDVPDIGEDYMDYSDLSCYSKFTQGQSDRMNWVISNVRSSLLACLSCQTPCPAPLTANITLPAINQTIVVGNTVNFAATATNSTSYTWNVGTDPSFDNNLLNTSYQFNSTGDFWVKFRAISSDPAFCNDAVDSVRIRVLCNVQPVFSVPPVITNGVATTFVNSSTNATSYEWLLDNVSIATTANLNYTFVNTGVYTLCLRATNAFCSSSLCSTIYVQQDGSSTAGCDNTFIQSLSNMGGSRPNIFPHPNGDFFATGLRNDSMVIVRFDQGGTALWARAFKFSAEALQIEHMFVDASGDLIGIARNEAPNIQNFRSTAFRYNPNSQTFTWIQRLYGPSYSQIHPLGANDLVLTAVSGTGATQLTRIDKGSGSIVGYNKTGEQGDYYSVLHNDVLYGACRRYFNSSGDFRASVFAHNPNTGAFLWQQSIISKGDTDGPTETRMYPEKPIIDDEHLLVIASGDLEGFDTYLTAPVELVVAKTDLLGTLDWTKQYIVADYNRPVANAILPTATGYYLVCNMYLTSLSNFGYGVVIKTDKQGHVQWAKRLGISGKNIVKNIMERNGYLYLSMASDSYAPNDLLLVKLDEAGNTNTACDFVQPVGVQEKTLPNIQVTRNYGVTNNGPTPQDVFTSSAPTSRTSIVYCNTPCICPDINVSAGADLSVCKGDSIQLFGSPGFETYHWSPEFLFSDPDQQNPFITTISNTTIFALDATKHGTELIVNSDFSLGNTGFTSAYIFDNQGFGHYWVTDDPLLYNPQWNIPLDHSPTNDNMMILFDGDINGTFPVMWQQSVLVQPNTAYEFKLWGAMAYIASPPAIEVRSNGIVLGTFNMQGNSNNLVGVWQPYSLNLNSGASSQLIFELRNLNTASIGNDFALDDISLQTICHYTDSVTVSVRNGNAGPLELGPDVTACSSATHTFDAGAGYESYLWSDFSTNRTFTAYGPGKYWVTAIDSCGAVFSDTVRINLSPAPTLELGADQTICRGDSLQLLYSSNGVFTTFSWTPAAGISCSTCASILAAPQVSTTYYLVASTADGCTNIDSIHIFISAPPATTQDVSICINESYTFNGNVYSAAGTYQDTLSTPNGCDSIVVTNLSLLPLQTKAVTIAFCPGDVVTISGVEYTQAGTVTDTLPATMGCDTVVTYTLVPLNFPQRSETIEFCAGEAINIGGVLYTQSGTVLDTVAAAVGCDTVVTYTLVQLSLPVRTEIIEFCKGDVITIGGTSYTLPGTVLDTLSAAVGCDTVVTYLLQYPPDGPSTLGINCPFNVSVAVLPGAGLTVVNYNLPTALTTCPCPGIELTLTEGLPPGGEFPTGPTTVCYAAKDSCGNMTSCCFQVFIREEQACDVKEIGCMKYELLNITADPGQNYTYRIRVTNKCANKLIYTAIQVPDGVVAMEPLGQTIFTSENGVGYAVNSPNYSPFYSIRFKSTTDSIANGESEIFRYTLPAQAVPVYINITSRLATQEFYESHLNTFYCPIGVTPTSNKPAERNLAPGKQNNNLRVFPNPNAGELFVDLSDWEGQNLQIRLLDVYGKQLQVNKVRAEASLYPLQVQETLPNGLYFIEVTDQNNTRQTSRMVLQR